MRKYRKVTITISDKYQSTFDKLEAIASVSKVKEIPYRTRNKIP